MDYEYGHFEGFCEKSKISLRDRRWDYFRSLNRYGKMRESVYTREEFDELSARYKAYLEKENENGLATVSPVSD